MTVKPLSINIGRKSFRGARRLSSEAGFADAIRMQVQELEDNYREWVGNIDGQGAEILYDALEPTFNLSQEIVPVDTGDLHDSGYLETRSYRGHAQVEIGYAKGGQPDYAVFVHENLDMHHEPPTQAKYLQQPIAEDGPNIQARIKLGYEIAAGFAADWT